MNEKTLREALKESRENRRKFLKEQMEIARKKEKENTIVCIMICISIIIFVFLSLFQLNSKEIKNCINAGNTIEACERGLYG